MIEDTNYFCVQGWMRNRLGLKGNELTVYAIIYGFSQDGEGAYSGSIKYIQEWLGIKSKQTVYSTINGLVEKGFIEKIEEKRNGVKFCSYKAVHVIRPMVQPVKQTTPERKLNSEDTINKEIIEYLNQKAGRSYDYNAKNTKATINARLKEGYSLEDFKHVIDVKCQEWKDDEKMNVYLRPATLFGPKFEGYRNQQIVQKKPSNKFNDFDQREYNDNMYAALEMNSWQNL